MEAVLGILAVVALAAPAGLAAAWFSTHGADALSTLFRPDHGLGWPHGVQEEEPTAWNWDRATRSQVADPRAEQAQPPAVAPVAFRVGPGSARDGWTGRDLRPRWR
jgi:hypothetical protein